MDETHSNHDDDLANAPRPEQPIESGTEESKISMLSDLRSRRAAILTNRTELFEVNGYSGKLWAEYRLMDYAELDKIAKRVLESENPRRDLLGMADQLAEGIVEFHYSDTGEREDAAPMARRYSRDELEPPIRYDSRLSELLDIGTETARGTVLGVFENDTAIVAHFNAVNAWMNGARKKAEDAFAGE